MEIKRLTVLPPAAESLASMAEEEGHAHVRRLVADFASRRNTFSGAGEALFAGFHGARLVAIGGVNIDPFEPTERVARVRRLYVDPGYRRCAAGTALMRAIETHARASGFRRIQLRTRSERADAFYVALGYERTASNDTVTHAKLLR